MRVERWTSFSTHFSAPDAERFRPAGAGRSESAAAITNGAVGSWPTALRAYQFERLRPREISNARVALRVTRLEITDSEPIDSINNFSVVTTSTRGKNHPTAVKSGESETRRDKKFD